MFTNEMLLFTNLRSCCHYIDYNIYESVPSCHETVGASDCKRKRSSVTPVKGSKGKRSKAHSHSRNKNAETFMDEASSFLNVCNEVVCLHAPLHRVHVQATLCFIVRLF